MDDPAVVKLRGEAAPTNPTTPPKNESPRSVVVHLDVRPARMDAPARGVPSKVPPRTLSSRAVIVPVRGSRIAMARRLAVLMLVVATGVVVVGVIVTALNAITRALLD